MDPVQEPRLVTRADVPRLRDRVRIVLSKEGRQYRSSQEVTTSVIILVVVCAATLFISMSEASAEAKFAESIGAFVVITFVSTAFLVKIRFKD
jgi:riboflavin biosynthesis pyrimidine reductase